MSDEMDERKSKRPFLKTESLKLGKPLQVKPRPLERVTTHELAPGGKLVLNDGQFIMKHATAADLAELKRVLEARMEARPKPPFYFKCSDPKCAWIMKAIRQLEPETPCLSCNRRMIVGGGILKPMTSKKEIAAYEEAVLKRLQETARIAKKMAKHAYAAWEQRVASGEFDGK